MEESFTDNSFLDSYTTYSQTGCYFILYVRGNSKFEAKLRDLLRKGLDIKFKLTFTLCLTVQLVINSIVFGEGGRENFYTCHKMYLCCIIALTVW
jgi:hypothetical protein